MVSRLGGSPREPRWGMEGERFPGASRSLNVRSERPDANPINRVRESIGMETSYAISGGSGRCPPTLKGLPPSNGLDALPFYPEGLRVSTGRAAGARPRVGGTPEGMP